MDLGDYVGEHLKELQWEEVKKCQQEQKNGICQRGRRKKCLEQIEQEKMENKIKQKILKEQEEHKIKKEREVKAAKAEVRLSREMGEQIPCYLLVLLGEILSPASGDFQFGKPQGDFYFSHKFSIPWYSVNKYPKSCFENKA